MNEFVCTGVEMITESVKEIRKTPLLLVEDLKKNKFRVNVS